MTISALLSDIFITGSTTGIGPLGAREDALDEDCFFYINGNVR